MRRSDMKFLELPIQILTIHRDRYQRELDYIEESGQRISMLPEVESLEMAIEELNYAIDRLTIDQMEFENPTQYGELGLIRREE